MTPDYDFERTLNEALSQYHDAEPLSGIEERVLARLRLAGVSHAPPKLWYVVAASTTLLAAVVLIGAYFSLKSRSPQSVASGLVRALPRPKLSTVITKNRSSAVLLRVKPKRNRVVYHKAVRQHEELSIPRLQGASVQARPSTQERTLIALGQVNPELLEDATRDVTQIAITPINIRPLHIENLDTGEN